MAHYVDVYLLPVPEANLSAYRKLAAKSGEIFRKYGAVSYKEFVASDLKAVAEVLPFPKVIELKEGETLIYSAVGFNSEEHRNETMKRIFDSKEMHEILPKEPIFDFKRMVYGGFSILVDA